MKATAKASLEAICWGTLAAAASNASVRAELPAPLHHRQATGYTSPAKPQNCTSSLREALAAKGARIFAQYGPALGWEQLLQVLADRNCVPYPCDLQFDAEPLLPGEFAHSVPKGIRPEEGFTIFLHPVYAAQLSKVPYLVLHQVVLASYGQLVTPEDAEVFGSQALGLLQEDYYRALCELAEQVGGAEWC